jgi:hypothetical protein
MGKHCRIAGDRIPYYAWEALPGTGYLITLGIAARKMIGGRMGDRVVGDQAGEWPGNGADPPEREPAGQFRWTIPGTPYLIFDFGLGPP